jgi:mRNA interferase RelE/StbE
VKVSFRKSFIRDLRKIQDQGVRDRIEAAILQIEAADELTQLHDLRKLKGDANFFRLRVGDYRIGLAVESDEIEFVRVLHRKDIYRYFR